ncbi:hypothetical protein SEA_AOKA_51 [Arthrobacter phage Aoka]|nr:hypothetical protein SEA_AOKA_51 [Arthrobacter phage Aoka]
MTGPASLPDNYYERRGVIPPAPAPDPYCDHRPFDACRCLTRSPIVRFLEARIAETEEAVRIAAETGLAKFGGDPAATAIVITGHDGRTLWDTDILLAECEAKRAIIRQHEAWPVLVEQVDDFPQISPADGLQGISLAMGRRIAWLTEREYIRRFGVEAPTAPMIRTLAAVYRDHPDYLDEWAAE